MASGRPNRIPWWRLPRWLVVLAILGLLFTPVECTLAYCPTPGMAAPVGPALPDVADEATARLVTPDDDAHVYPTTPPRVINESPGAPVPVRPATLTPAGVLALLVTVPGAPAPSTLTLVPPDRYLTGPTPPPP